MPRPRIDDDAQPPLVPMSAEELQDAGRQLARLTGALAEMEMDHAEIRKEQKTERDKLRSEILGLAYTIRTARTMTCLTAALGRGRKIGRPPSVCAKCKRQPERRKRPGRVWRACDCRAKSRCRRSQPGDSAPKIGMACIAAYGAACACCGERQYEFLESTT